MNQANATITQHRFRGTESSRDEAQTIRHNGTVTVTNIRKKNRNRRTALKLSVGKLLDAFQGRALRIKIGPDYFVVKPVLLIRNLVLHFLMQLLITNTVDSRYLDLAYLE